MPGPPPKPASQRRRRNGEPKPVKLAARSANVAPTLPGARNLLRETRAWWATVWSSPMAGAYLEADVPALARLAGLLDRVQRGETSSRLLGEVRALEDRFGLSPLARRRLQWEVQQAATAAQPPRNDEERWLRAVSD